MKFKHLILERTIKIEAIHDAYKTQIPNPLAEMRHLSFVNFITLQSLCLSRTNPMIHVMHFVTGTTYAIFSQI